MLQELAPDARILQIDDRRAFDYESVYFDTPEFTSYHLSAHSPIQDPHPHVR